MGIARRASKLRPRKIELLANRLSRVPGSDSGRKATNGQKRGDELHIGGSQNLT